MKPRLLDLFCGGGGAARGYHDAGWAVVGVDNQPQPDYPYEFHRADAIEYLQEHGTEFQMRHASPPCQPYSSAVKTASSKYSHTLGRDEPALIATVHTLLCEIGGPWVIENVMGARPQMPFGLTGPFVLCGAMFGLKIPRHRVFASSEWLYVPEHDGCWGLADRSAKELGWNWRDLSVTGKGRHAGTSERWSYLLGIDWHMTQHQLAEAIPPAYTHHIGKQLLPA